MGASLQEQERQLVVVLLPSHQPVGLYVTFPNATHIASQFVGAILLWQSAVCCKQVDGIFNQFDVQATLHAAFQVPVETVGIVNLVHSLKFV